MTSRDQHGTFSPAAPPHRGTRPRGARPPAAAAAAERSGTHDPCAAGARGDGAASPGRGGPIAGGEAGFRADTRKGEGPPRSGDRSTDAGASDALEPFAGIPHDLPEPAREAFLRVVHAVLAHGASGPDALAALEAAAPDHPLPPALRGLVLMSLGRRETVEAARTAHAEAVRRAGGADGAAREHAGALLGALGDWLAGRPIGAADRLDAHLAAAPGGLLAAKLSHAIRFMAGDRAGMLASIARARARGAAEGRAAGYLAGCHAFALEETGAYAEAEATGRAALALAPDDAWGLHAVAHVFETTLRPAEGIGWIAGRRAAVAHCNNFRGHVFWHEALFALETGDHGRVLALYDAEIRREATDDFRDVANAASLLARLSFEGVPVGARWEELADIAERRIADRAYAFADLHYALALAGAGRDRAAARLATGLAAAAARPDAADETGAAAVAGPAAAAIALFGQGRHRAALARLVPVLDDLVRIGGSNAQRDVFVRLAVEAAVAAGDAGTARALMVRRARAAGGFDRFARERLARLGRATTQAPAPVDGRPVPLPA